MSYQQCPSCSNLRRLTRHHVIPRRWKTGSTTTVLFCRECHDEVEKVIYARERQNRGRLEAREYWLIVQRFTRR